MTMQPALQVFSRRARPIARTDVYGLYWLFASRRQQIFEQRVAGAQRPWSNDPILETFKFCNVFRAADRVSQYMIRDVAYGRDEGSAADRIFQIVAFRTFSNPRTWEGVRQYLGESPKLTHLASGAFEQALDQVRAQYGGLYTGAFILCATKAFGFDEKHRNHVALFRHMFIESRVAERLTEAKSLSAMIALLESFPLMGPFMAYQTAIDLCYSELFNFSENDHTQAGPGALRGLKKAFEDLGDYSPADAILWMVERQDEEFARLGLPFAGLFGRKLHGIDCQGLFCELDKYCREAVPDLKSARSRIKARFTPSPEPLSFFFPPKWNLASGLAMPAAKTAEAGLFDFLPMGTAPSRRQKPQTSKAQTSEAMLLI